jgi:hypothetical protein
MAPLLRPHSMNKDNKIDPHMETQTRTALILWRGEKYRETLKPGTFVGRNFGEEATEAWKATGDQRAG